MAGRINSYTFVPNAVLSLRTREVINMAKVGLYVFTNKVKKRGTRKNSYFESEKYTGFRHIINEIDRGKHCVEFCSSANMNRFDFVLVPIISFYDVINLINELKGKKRTCKVVVGGPGVFNIRGYKDYIDIAVFRRAEGIINKVLEMEPLDNVWYKEYDEGLKNIYEIGKPRYLLGDEKSVGCSKKCKFCQYSWTNGYKTKKEKGKYTSGYSEYEDFFLSFDWEKARKNVVTALDASTEYGRKKIGKYISNKEIIEKLRESNHVDANKRLSVKIYNIIGYEWEDEESARLEEIRETLKEASQYIKNKVILSFHFSHFVPMQHTPFWYYPVNRVNYKEIFNRSERNYILCNTDNLQAYTGNWGTTPAYAIEECLIERAWEEHAEIIEKTFTSKKYWNLSAMQKMILFEKEEYDYASRRYSETEDYPTNYIISPFNKKNR